MLFSDPEDTKTPVVLDVLGSGCPPQILHAIVLFIAVVVSHFMPGRWRWANERKSHRPVHIVFRASTLVPGVELLVLSRV
jgi:hypothetical protein